MAIYIATGNIGNALHSVAPEHIVATADEVYDKQYKLKSAATQGAYQSEINQEIYTSSISASADLSASLCVISQSISQSISESYSASIAYSSASLAAYSASVGTTIVKVRTTSGSWDKAKDWTGANSGNLATFTSSLKSLKVSTGGPVSYSEYNPTGSNVTWKLPSTASHLGALPQDAFDSYSASQSADLTEFSKSVSQSISRSYSQSALDLRNYSSSVGTTIVKVRTSSGSWDNVAGWVGSNSASLVALSSSVTQNSASWNNARNWLGSNTASLNAVTGTVGSNSASWNSAASWSGAHSASLNSVQTKVTSTSASWDAAHSWVTNKSASFKNLIIKKGAVTTTTDQTFCPTGSDVTIQIPTTASHLGGVAISQTSSMTVKTANSASHANFSVFNRTGDIVTASIGNQTKTVDINNPTNAKSASHANFSALTLTGNILTASVGNQTRYVTLTGLVPSTASYTPFTVFEQKSYYLTASVGSTTRVAIINSSSYAKNADTASYNEAGATAYSWGNHANAGYVKSSGVTSIASGDGLTGGPITTTGTMSINSATMGKINSGNTAYGWGNHANAGYVKSSGVTAINVKSGSNYLVGDTHITSTGTASLDLSSATKGKVESGSAAHIWITNNSASIGNNLPLETGSAPYSLQSTTASVASGTASFAHGLKVTASGNYSHAEGQSTKASGHYSHAEGRYTTASGIYSHAEGYYPEALGQYSHAEGLGTKASGNYSHAEGGNVQAIGEHSHAEGWGTEASGMGSHAEGRETIASNDYEHAQGRCNVTASGQIFSVGAGDKNTRRKNAVSIITGGGETPSASVYVYGIGGYDGTNPQPGTNDLASTIHTHTNKAVLDAVKPQITGSVGDTGTPVYFSGGVPTTVTRGQVACPATASGVTSGTVTLNPGEVTNCGTLTGNLTIALANGNTAVNGHCPIYHVIFNMGSSVRTITLPSGVSLMNGSAELTEVNKTYEINIMNNVAVINRTA